MKLPFDWCLVTVLSPRTSGLDPTSVYGVCPKSKCTDFLFKCLLDSPEITSYLLQSMTLGKLNSGCNVFPVIIAVPEFIVCKCV